MSYSALAVGATDPARSEDSLWRQGFRVPSGQRCKSLSQPVAIARQLRISRNTVHRCWNCRMTSREIKLALEAQGLFNPDTVASPTALGTVERDMKALSDLWRAETITDVNDHLAGKLQELAELNRLPLKRSNTAPCSILSPESAPCWVWTPRPSLKT